MKKRRRVTKTLADDNLVMVLTPTSATPRLIRQHMRDFYFRMLRPLAAIQRNLTITSNRRSPPFSGASIFAALGRTHTRIKIGACTVITPRGCRRFLLPPFLPPPRRRQKWRETKSFGTPTRIGLERKGFSEDREKRFNKRAFFRLCCPRS